VKRHHSFVRHSPKRAGFTILELSIVLVIIGLIIGGILVGRDMIRMAALRNMGSQIEKYRTAFNTFRLKYNCLPGDCPNATDYFGTYAGCGGDGSLPTGFPAGTCNGNGDGVIGPPANYSNGIDPTTGEWLLFWNHLSNANLITGSYGCPYPVAGFDNWYSTLCSPTIQAPRGATAFITIRSGTNWSDPANLPIVASKQNISSYFLVGAYMPSSAVSNPWSMMSPNEAFILDTKFDDGSPYSGKISTYFAPAAFRVCSNTITGKYVSSDVYVMTDLTSPTAYGCSLYFDLDN
jgi:prepilin-type N-terminal cleavage/methylation domain-containing protein